MKLKRFIKELENISKKYGPSATVLMADCAQITSPIYFETYGRQKKAVVITDQNIISCNSSV